MPIFPDFRQFAQKSVTIATSLRNREKVSLIMLIYIRIQAENLVKIGYAHSEIIGL